MSFVPQEGIEADGLVLREVELADVADLAPAFVDPAVGGEAGLPRLDETGIRTFLADQLPAMRAAGQLIPMSVRDTSSHELLGGAMFQRVDPFRLKVEIGYWLYVEARGRGVATRATRAMAAHAFGRGLARVEAVVRVGNASSERVLERAGFTREGVLRSYLVHGGARADATMFSLLAGE